MVGPGAELHALAAAGLQVAQVEVRGFALKGHQLSSLPESLSGSAFVILRFRVEG